MDDSFAFHGTRDPRRLDPWALRLAVAGLVLVLVAVTLMGWAVSSERTSFHRLAEENAAAARQALAQSRQSAVAQAAQPMVAVPATIAPSAAAPQGTCYYVKVAVKVAPTDAVRYGTGAGCTGADAMGATGSAW